MSSSTAIDGAGSPTRSYRSRRIGLHERFCLARNNVGYAPIVCIVGSFSLGPSSPSSRLTLEDMTRIVSTRIDNLLALLPLLSSRIEDRYDPKTTWIPPCAENGVEAATILHLHPMQHLPSQEQGNDERMGEIMHTRREAWMHDVDVESGPLWRVDLYPFSSSSSSSSSSPAASDAGPDEVVVSLTTHHVMVDGKGAVNLFSTLLAASPSPFDLECEARRWGEETRRITGRRDADEDGAGALPPTSDGDLDMKPSWRILLPVLVETLLKPLLPQRVWQWYAGAESWPGHLPSSPESAHQNATTRGLRKPPHLCPAHTSILSLSTPRLLSRLKRRGSKHGVATVQGLVHAAASVSLWYAAITGNDENEDREGQRGIRVTSETPFSARVPARGHGACTGNYVGDLPYTATLDPATSFWNMARRYADLISKPSTLQDALQGLGLLSYIPDHPPSSSPTTPRQGGMEAFFTARMHSPTPHRCSFGLSNLGALDVDALLAPCRNVVWSQTPSPFGPAILLDCIGFKRSHSQRDRKLGEEEEEEGRGQVELAISISHRRGALDPGVVSRFEGTLRSVVLFLAGQQSDDEDDGQGDITVEQLVQASLEGRSRR
ncbi:uncharacterized protein PFL1_05437 [Pseudozyma flocculosa PF-1]|uniref:Uncharacterized protein n=2 Tax=Pseudozyma flocculosa TaxID=84751 RepID=A0A5C3F9Y9_9BASI|nr:uncharacterized protein PFL1_05437 [Pseudozyma flocculosa PF-1]EPQ27156.1 hypothetical protein PFL1_05437 [Pseudozyma flocculosa PF-1]SPO41263.1 uncharacterized protein PSFLO_06745 [Pseudozyma flocculosa]